MKITSDLVEEHERILQNLCEREKQEFQASEIITSETLEKLNVTIENLPQKCQQLLKTASKTTQHFRDLDPIVVSLKHSKQMSEDMEQDYEILNLRQTNKQLQAKINRNQKEINDLRRELMDSKGTLASLQPGPEGILDVIRQMRVKVASYEESCDKAKAKFTKQGVPEALYPKSLEVLINQLSTLKKEEAELRLKAEDTSLTREMRQNLVRLLSSDRQ